MKVRSVSNHSSDYFVKFGNKMSFPTTNDPIKSCVSKFSLSLGEQNFFEARYWLYNINRVNSTQLIYMKNTNEENIVNSVYCWDIRPYQKIFINGFQAWSQGEIPNYIYYLTLLIMEVPLWIQICLHLEHTYL